MGFTSQDQESYDIMQHFEEVYSFVNQARQSQGRCLIHCMAGINRSGCLATACVMLIENIGPICAARKVFELRGMLLSNSGFVERLVKFAAERGLLQKDKDQIMPLFRS